MSTEREKKAEAEVEQQVTSHASGARAAASVGRSAPAVGASEGAGEIGREAGARREVRWSKVAAPWRRRACMAMADAEVAAAVEAATADLLAERKSLKAEVKRVREYAPSPRLDRLLKASSLGSEDVRRRSEGVNRDVARVLVRWADQIGHSEKAEARAEKAEAEVARLTATIGRVEALHQPRTYGNGQVACNHCDNELGGGTDEWPCPTLVALAEPQDGGQP